MTNIVKINGKECDLSLAFPIKLGVYKTLLRKGVDPSKGEMTTLESMTFMECVVNAANPEITESDCDTLTPDEFTEISNIVNELSVSKKEKVAPLEHG